MLSYSAVAPISSIVVGEGGHARSVVACLLQNPKYHLVGVVATENYVPSEQILGVDVLGSLNLLDSLLSSGVTAAYIALGSGEKRQMYSRLVIDCGFETPALIHPTAQVHTSAKICEGTHVMANTYVGPLSVIEEGVLLNTGSILEHESVIGCYTTISPSVTIAGRTAIGANSFVGIGANIADGLAVGSNTTIGAGALVLSDVESNNFVVGVPARTKTNEDAR